MIVYKRISGNYSADDENELVIINDDNKHIKIIDIIKI